MNIYHFCLAMLLLVGCSGEQPGSSADGSDDEDASAEDMETSDMTAEVPEDVSTEMDAAREVAPDTTDDVLVEEPESHHFCGDGVRDPGEECDGYDLSRQTCMSYLGTTGDLDCSESCTFDVSSCDTCGNGAVNRREECDGSELNGKTCASFGYSTGFLSCTDACVFDTSGCSECGNRHVEAGEDCDADDLSGLTCTDHGFDAGELGCTISCTWDTSRCRACGNGVIEPGEECDGTDLAGETCVSLGFASGTLRCDSYVCTFDSSGCESCGNSVIDSGEDCDGTDLGGETCSSLGFSGGTLTCTTSCTLDSSACSVCGDGSVGAGETCEDMNSIDWDGCTDCNISEFQTNTYWTNVQDSPSVSTAPDGRFVVVWCSHGQDGDRGGVYGQRYGPSGLPDGSEFRANTRTIDYQWAPDVGSDSTGAFVVTWGSGGDQDGDGFGIYFQRFDSSGTPAGVETRANTYTTSHQDIPAVCMAPDGRFCLAWTSANQDGDRAGIFGQCFDSTGSAVGTEFQANTYTAGAQVHAMCDMAPDGTFVVAWRSEAQDGDDWGIFAQRFDSTGTRIGTEFRVNTYTAGAQYDPAVEMFADASYIITWSSAGQDGSGAGVYAQRFSSSGTAVGPEFRVNTYTASNQSGGSVAAALDGRFVITWMSYGQDGSGSGIFAQRYDASGSAVGPEYQVNVYTTDEQREPMIDLASDGRFVIAWECEHHLDGDFTGCYAQRFNSAGEMRGFLAW